jgi:hypothetical protein
MSTRNFGEENNFKGIGKKIRSTQIHLGVAISVPKFDCGCNQWIHTPSFYLQNSRRDHQKTNFDCQIYKKWEALIRQKINSPLIHLRIGIFKKNFHWWICISIVHSSRKIRFRISKNKGKGRGKLILIAWFFYKEYGKKFLHLFSYRSSKLKNQHENETLLFPTISFIFSNCVSLFRF